MARSQNGIALVEILIAAAILASACVILNRSVLESVRMAFRSHERFLAVLTAERAAWLLDRQPETTPVFQDSGLAEAAWQTEKRLEADERLQTTEVLLRWKSPSAPDHISVGRYEPYAKKK